MEFNFRNATRKWLRCTVIGCPKLRPAGLSLTRPTICDIDLDLISFSQHIQMAVSWDLLLPMYLLSTFVSFPAVRAIWFCTIYMSLLIVADRASVLRSRMLSCNQAEPVVSIASLHTLQTSIGSQPSISIANLALKCGHFLYFSMRR